MGCSPFTVNVKDVKVAVAKVKKAIANEKGTSSGDETSGTFAVNGSVFLLGKYTIKGSYTVKDLAITISLSITSDSPKAFTCKAVEEKVREWLK